MAIFSMNNDNIEASIDEHASEITKLKDSKTNIEYIWQGDPKYWSGKNPTLFPMVGSTYNKEIVINGKTYTMGNHGFARHSDFTCTKHEKSIIEMTLTDNETTLKQYPFHFEMKIRYELVGRKLIITYTVENRNDCMMPFNFGLHPAFNCPLDPKKTFSDYYISYSNQETFTSQNISLHKETKVSLDRDSLMTTIQQTNPFSSKVSLTDGTHSVTLSIVGYQYLAFWSPKDAPFVCIEPWHSHGDIGEVKLPFEQREGTIRLDPHRTYTTAYTIEVE